MPPHWLSVMFKALMVVPRTLNRRYLAKATKTNPHWKIKGEYRFFRKWYILWPVLTKTKLPEKEGRKDSWSGKNIVTHPFIWGAPLISGRKTEREQTAGTCACIVRQAGGKVTAAQRREVIPPVHRHVHFHAVVQLREFNQQSENRYI